MGMEVFIESMIELHLRNTKFCVRCEFDLQLAQKLSIFISYLHFFLCPSKSQAGVDALYVSVLMGWISK